MLKPLPGFTSNTTCSITTIFHGAPSFQYDLYVDGVFNASNIQPSMDIQESFLSIGHLGLDPSWGKFPPPTVFYVPTIGF